ncbi:MAG: YfhO family protein [Vampirovibrio sp.]|nr:YfhO family protein [Vampirovibrio sp.]
MVETLKRITKNAWPIWGIFFIWLVMWWPVLWGGQVLFLGDLMFYALPMKTFMLSELADGRFPFWTPHVSGGMPFFADPTQQVLYPLNAIFFLTTSVLQGLSWFVIFHFLLAFGGVYVLARSIGLSRAVGFWVSVLYGLSGVVISSSTNVNYLPALGWMPLGLGLFIRGITTKRSRLGYSPYTAGVALCSAMMVLGGDTLYVFFLAGFTLLFCMFWYQGWWMRLDEEEPPELVGYGPLLHWAGSFGLCGLVCAMQLLGTAELASLSVRQSPLALDEITLQSFPPQRLIEWVQPFFFGSKYPNPHYIGVFLYPKFNEPWFESIYLGIIPILFTGVAVWRKFANSRFWLVVLGISLLVAFGRYGPYYEQLLSILRPLQYQRYPEKILLYADMALCLLAGIGLQSALKDPKALFKWIPATTGKKIFLGIGLLVGSLILFIGLPAIWLIAPYAKFRSVEWGPHFYDRGAHVMGLAWHGLVIAAPLAGVLFMAKAKQKVALTGLAVLAVLDLGWAHAFHIPTLPATLFEQQPTSAALDVMDAPEKVGPYRVFYDDFVDPDMVHKNPGLMKYLSGASKTIHGVYASPPSQNGYKTSYQIYWPYFTLYNRERLLFNYGVSQGLSYLNGRFSPLQPKAHQLLYRVMMQQAPVLLMQLNNVRYVLTSTVPENPRWQHPSVEEVKRFPKLNLRVLKVTDTLPRAYLAQNPVYNTDPQRFSFLSPDIQDIHTQAEIMSTPLTPPDEPLIPKQPDRIVLTRQVPGRYEMTAESPYEKSFLILLDSHYPGWQAMIDDKPTPIMTANKRHMAVPIRQGRHKVKVWYEPDYWKSGVTLSVLGLLLCLLCFVLPCFKKGWLPR